jgi:hypothetical protein
LILTVLLDYLLETKVKEVEAVPEMITITTQKDQF